MQKETNGAGKLPKVDFRHFLEKFPEVELPITLGEEAHHDFSLTNDPLPTLMIAQYIDLIEGGESDELTEFIACFQIPETGEFYAVVYWKAELMAYQYVLATFSKKGVLIDKRTIAGTYSDGKTLTQSVATIDEDWTIHIVTGQTAVERRVYDASSSTAYELEILPDGQIVNT
jgi:hypothetical protein